jgi:hypothetical protein
METNLISAQIGRISCCVTSQDVVVGNTFAAVQASNTTDDDDDCVMIVEPEPEPASANGSAVDNDAAAPASEEPAAKRHKTDAGNL